MTSGQTIGKMDTQKKLSVPLDREPRDVPAQGAVELRLLLDFRFFGRPFSPLGRCTRAKFVDLPELKRAIGVSHAPLHW